MLRERLVSINSVSVTESLEGKKLIKIKNNKDTRWNKQKNKAENLQLKIKDFQSLYESSITALQ